jgi:hypothetical protein
MPLLGDEARPVHFANLPVTHALRATRRSPNWKLFQGWRPRRKNRQAGLIGSGTRKGQALVKRLARRESGEIVHRG